jgi:uncharacterized Zn finger protein
VDSSPLDLISQIVFSKNFDALSFEERQLVLDSIDNVLEEPPSRSNNKRNWWLQILLDKVDRSAGKDRASRGRSYWRKGKVGKRLTITRNIGIGTVRGSSSGRYDVAIRIEDNFKDHTELIATAIANDPACYVDFREGRLNQKLLELTLGDGSNLFKDHLQMVGYCDCYDWEAICKHQVALANAIADQVQEDLDLALTFLGIDPKVLNDLVSQLREGESKELPHNNRDNVTDSFGWPTYSDIGRVTSVRRFGKPPTLLAEQLRELEKQAIDPVGTIPKNRINSNLGSFNDIFETIYELVRLNAQEERGTEN